MIFLVQEGGICLNLVGRMGTHGPGAVTPGAYSCCGLARTVIALDSRTWGTALAPSGDFLVLTSFLLWNGLAVWLPVRSARSIELSLVSWSRFYIVPTCPLVAPPMCFRRACLRLGSLASQPRFPRLLLFLVLSLACSGPSRGSHHRLAPLVLTPLCPVTR